MILCHPSIHTATKQSTMNKQTEQFRNSFISCGGLYNTRNVGLDFRLFLCSEVHHIYDPFGFAYQAHKPSTIPHTTPSYSGFCVSERWHGRKRIKPDKWCSIQFVCTRLSRCVHMKFQIQSITWALDLVDFLLLLFSCNSVTCVLLRLFRHRALQLCVTDVLLPLWHSVPFSLIARQ